MTLHEHTWTEWLFGRIAPVWIGWKTANFVVGLENYFPGFYERGIGRLLEDPVIERALWGFAIAGVGLLARKYVIDPLWDLGERQYKKFREGKYPSSVLELTLGVVAPLLVGDRVANYVVGSVKADPNLERAGWVATVASTALLTRAGVAYLYTAIQRQSRRGRFNVREYLSRERENEQN